MHQASLHIDSILLERTAYHGGCLGDAYCVKTVDAMWWDIYLGTSDSGQA